MCDTCDYLESQIEDRDLAIAELTKRLKEAKRVGAKESLTEIRKRIKFQTDSVGFATPRIAIETMVRIIDIYEKELEGE